MAQRLIFLLGGARSGKSRYAEEWARQQGGRVLFVATAQAFDTEMEERIRRHRQERPPEWTTLEAASGAGEAIQNALSAASYELVLVDCLTLLAANVLLALPEEATQLEVNRAVLAETDRLLATVHASQATW